MKSKRSKACDISATTKKIVWERDNQRCIICGDRKACRDIIMRYLKGQYIDWSEDELIYKK